VLSLNKTVSAYFCPSGGKNDGLSEHFAQRQPKLVDCQLDCQSGGLRRILVNRTETASPILNTKWTLADLYEHSVGALENCYRCKPIQGSNPCPSARFETGSSHPAGPLRGPADLPEGMGR
jgi:hypothetical protein